MHRRAVALALGCLLLPAALPAQDPAPDDPRPAPTPTDSTAPTQPVVRAVLFFSPTCPHCREVMTETLPPVLARYGDQLQIATVNTATPGGQALYRATVEHLRLSRSRIGVPTLLVGSRTLVGALEIPGMLPGIVDEALQADGIAWPDVPLIQQALAAAQPAPGDADQQAAADPAEGDSGTTPGEATSAVADRPAAPLSDAPDPGPQSPGDPAGTREPPADRPAAVADDAATVELEVGAAPPEPAEGTASSATAEELAAAFDAEVTHTLSMADRFLTDPTGNAAAVSMLILMLVALGLVGADVAGRVRIPRWPGWAVPVLAIAGAVVAGYLTYVEVTGTAAVCGPVGDCNTVQQSPYATLFGVIPVGALGLLGYALFVAAWAMMRIGSDAGRRLAWTSLWSLALTAVLFSVYLTFLEPFVIGATCAWCLTSAAITTLILLAATAERHAGPTLAPSHPNP